MNATTDPRLEGPSQRAVSSAKRLAAPTSAVMERITRASVLRTAVLMSGPKFIMSRLPVCRLL